MTFVFFLNAVEYSTMGHFSSVKIAHYQLTPLATAQSPCEGFTAISQIPSQGFSAAEHSKPDARLTVRVYSFGLSFASGKDLMLCHMRFTRSTPTKRYNPKRVTRKEPMMLNHDAAE